MVGRGPPTFLQRLYQPAAAVRLGARSPRFHAESSLPGSTHACTCCTETACHVRACAHLGPANDICCCQRVGGVGMATVGGSVRHGGCAGLLLALPQSSQVHLQPAYAAALLCQDGLDGGACSAATCCQVSCRLGAPCPLNPAAAGDDSWWVDRAAPPSRSSSHLSRRTSRGGPLSGAAPGIHHSAPAPAHARMKICSTTQDAPVWAEAAVR
jgi:hypothetical protein